MKDVLAQPDLGRLLGRLSRRFSVDRMTPDRAEDLVEFLQRAYQDQPIAVFRDAERAIVHWKWVTELCPPSGAEAPIGWICLKGHRLVGYFGISPAIAHVRGRAVPVCWGRDLIGAPETRSAGVGPLLIQAVVRESQRPFLIAGLNPVSFSLFRRMGFVDLGRIPLYIKIHQANRFAEGLPWPGWVSRAAVVSLQIAGSFRESLTRRENSGICVEELHRFDERFDRWWKDLEASFPCVIRRTSATMNWRYFQHPRHRYTVLVATEGSRWRGLAVVRHGHSRGLPGGFITELLADPRDRFGIAALLKRAEERLRQSASEPPVLIRCALHQPLLERGLIRAGFFRVPSPLYWMISSALGSDGLRSLVRREDWMINGGDSDLDAV